MKKNKKDTLPPKHQEDLAAELTALRANFIDILSRYQVNQEAKLLACIESLSEQSMADPDSSHPDEKHILMILEQLHELRLKPEKGRFKDVRRINDLVDEIYARLVRMS
ncbi:MAG TPA: hypothetical protein PLG50_09200 [bacterium]|nr:hypothetical protein [bacterium]HQG45823.1 hypothetical protein [bacterium]HQI49987.1 hypothetical protein [bacterium]HQJ64582.1 hypothetical protein [bacterium]